MISLFCLLLSALLSWGFGKRIRSCRERGKSGRLPLCLGTGLLLGELLFFRYGQQAAFSYLKGGFFLELSLSAAAPFALAFIVLKGISFLAESYRGGGEKASFGGILLYLSLFFNVAGPAVCYDEFSGVAAGRGEPDLKNGFYLFAIGFSKKLILAEGLGALWQDIQGEAAVNLSCVSVFLGALAYFLAVCMGMSGYSDMAEGLGLIFGYSLRKNTDYPLLSVSISEFWRRFLSGVRRFFSIYLEQPLSRGEKSGFRAGAAVVVSYLCLGMFLGEGLHYLLFGLAFGLAAVLENQTALLQKLSFPLRRAFTLITAVFAFTFCGAGSFKRWSALFQVAMGANGFLMKRDVYYLSSYWLLFLLCLLIGGRVFDKSLYRFNKNHSRLERVTKPLCTALLFFISVAFLINISESPYIFLPL